MSSRRVVVAFLLAFGAAVPFAASADVVLIPPAGQSAEQVALDQSDCQAIAARLTGFDPAQGAVVAPAAPAPAAAAAKPATGGRARGAVRGAAAGAVVAEARTPDVGGGELEDAYKEERVEDAAKAGAVAGASRQRQDRRQAASQQAAAQQQATQAQAAQVSELQLSFDLAARACLMGRGYQMP